MVTTRTGAVRLVGVALVAVVALPAGRPGVAGAQIAAVKGSAVGYWADEISLFGGAQPDTGPTPAAELAPDGSNSPQLAHAPTGLARYGPATIFSSDDIVVLTSASSATAAEVRSLSTIANVNSSVKQPTLTGSEVFTAATVSASCTASEAGATGSTTILGGSVRTHAQGEDHDEGVVEIPANPPPNYKLAGHVHLGTHQDNFVIVFNEQVDNGDGSMTVTAVHEYFGATLDAGGNIVDDPNSILQGDLYLGRVVCGVTAG